MSSPLMTRLAKELAILEKDPPPGVAAWPTDSSNATLLTAEIQGPADSPYERGCFRLRVIIPQRYPFEPPGITFETPVYHPNVDGQGRICLDVLKMPPKGGWRPSLNLSTTLTSIRLLLSEPNPDDPLLAEVAKEYRENRQQFLTKARESTRLNAMGGKTDSGALESCASSEKRTATSPSRQLEVVDSLRVSEGKDTESQTDLPHIAKNCSEGATAEDVKEDTPNGGLSSQAKISSTLPPADKNTTATSSTSDQIEPAQPAQKKRKSMLSLKSAKKCKDANAN